MTDEQAAWLHKQIDDDERWALACNRPYEYADDGATPPTAGVHWRWVHGPNWETTTPNPVVNEFVAEPGQPCNLATVEQWPSKGRQMPRVYSTEIVEMDSSAAGHIIRHDPYRELREVAFKRRILAIHRRRADVNGEMGSMFDDCCDGCGYEGICDDPVVEHVKDCPERRALAAVYDNRPGYHELWGKQ
ncbi:DUF6221 family protein [Micromonospora sp. NBC_00421]|uniref:DUF6221 family protein n=1 Tax=Micromonospora sp. NBC_00421 TaxID=2975976 RepID=UPI002E242262